MNNSTLSNASNSMAMLSRGTALVVAESCIFVLMALAALVGNVLVCLAFYRNPSLRTVTNYFVLSLAITDLSAALFTMPLKAASTVAKKWIAGEMGCKVDYFFASVTGGVSLLTVMLLAINRYMRIIKPDLYPTIYTKKRSIVMAVSAWIVTIAVVVMKSVIAGLRFQTFTILPTFCIHIVTNPDVSIAITVVDNIYIVAPLIAIVACYLRISQTVHNHNTAVTPQVTNTGYGVEEAKMTRVLTVVVVGFCLCWLPVLVTNILSFLNLLGRNSIIYLNFYITFPLFTSIILNPIIYATMSSKFRAEFRKILQLFPTPAGS